MCWCCWVTKSCLTLWQSSWLESARLLGPRSSPGKNAGVGCHFLLHGSFLPRDWTCISCIGRQVLHHWANLGSPQELQAYGKRVSRTSSQRLCCGGGWSASPHAAKKSFTVTKTSFLATNIKTRLLNVQRCNSIWGKSDPIGSPLQTRTALAFVGSLVLPQRISGKECRRLRRGGFGPGEGNGTPLQHSCLENPMDRGDWRATVHGIAESWMWPSTRAARIPGPLV